MQLYNRISERIALLLHRLLMQKLNTVTGYLIIGALAVSFGYLIATKTLLGFGVLGLSVGLFTFIVCLLFPETGLYINIFYSFFAFHFNRFLFNNAFPIGIVSDILIVGTFLGIFVGKREKVEFPLSAVVIGFITLYIYIGLELFNPYSHSVLGWLQTIRKVAAEFILLFIGYNVFTTKAAIKRFVMVLFFLATICGLYGCIQQWHGLFDFELAWAMGDENRFGLIFINGDFRKFSTMSDPTAYGIVMAATAVLYIVLATGQKNRMYKYGIYLGVVCMLLGMAYSGTRTANAMAVAGLALFVLLTVNNKATRIFAISGGLILLVILYGPFYGNATINRFRTTFTGTGDESFKVRQVNKAYIQPYIRSHPIGGGLGTTGAGGLRYNPSHRLAGFPPDSGYLKIALEFGWIGLAIICTLYFLILKNGVHVYFKSRDRQIKMLYAGCVSFFFCFYVAQYAQDSLGQITDIVIYYPLVAITLRSRILDSAAGNADLKNNNPA